MGLGLVIVLGVKLVNCSLIISVTHCDVCRSAYPLFTHGPTCPYLQLGSCKTHNLFMYLRLDSPIIILFQLFFFNFFNFFIYHISFSVPRQYWRTLNRVLSSAYTKLVNLLSAVSSRPTGSFNSSLNSRAQTKYSSEHELVEFGIALPVLITETLSAAVGQSSCGVSQADS